MSEEEEGCPCCREYFEKREGKPSCGCGSNPVPEEKS